MSITERAERLAANLLADRQRQRERPKHNIVPCWSCGTTYVYRGRQGDLTAISARCAARLGLTTATPPMSSNASMSGSLRALR